MATRNDRADRLRLRWTERVRQAGASLRNAGKVARNFGVAAVQSARAFIDGAPRQIIDAARRRPFTRTGRQYPKTINLALQGGGAHGAFTWGVLDRLLEEDRLRFDSVSGTSAGAVNAVLLAAGLQEDGAAGAKAKLDAFWRGISHNGHALLAPDNSLSAAFDLVSRFVSPYQFLTLDYNPIREHLENLVDFTRLRRHSSLGLYIAATDVANGQQRIFGTGELSLDAVLASTCLPQVHRAVKIGKHHYWDGGYAANPVLMPLVLEAGSGDTLLVQLIPLADPEVPKQPQEIGERLNRIIFNAALRREIELIELGRSLTRDGLVLGGRRHRRFRSHRFHLIDASRTTRDLSPGSRLNPDRRLIEHLHERGRAAADRWLGRNFEDIGQASTADLAASHL